MTLKKTFSTLLLAAILCAPFTVSAQVTIGSGEPPSEWSLLDLSNYGQEQPRALHLPRMTDGARDSLFLIPNLPLNYRDSARGLMIFNTDNECVEFWSGTRWISFCEGDEPPFIPPPHFNPLCRDNVAYAECFATLRRFNSTVRRLADVTNPVSDWVSNPDQNARTFTIPNTTVSFNMMPVTGGVFYMGAQNTNPAHPNHNNNDALNHVAQVGVSSFYMSQTLVTAELFAAVMGANGTFHGQLLTPVTGLGTQWGSGVNIPRNNVSWYDAVVFANRLSVLLGRDTVYSHDSLDLLNPPSIPTSNNATWNAIRQNLSRNGFRLPTDAEWEYAARGGQRNEYTRTLGASGTQFLWSGSNTPTDVSWHNFHAGLFENQPVRGLAPNQLGLFDMSGLVWERVWDWSALFPCCSTNPVGPASGSSRLSRGGSWNSFAAESRITFRVSSAPGTRANATGFRLAASAP